MFKNILFLGCGNMGRAILQKMLENNIFQENQITVVKPSTKNLLANVNYQSSLNFLHGSYQADLVFVCVKPQDSQQVLNELFASKITNPNTIFISIMAGKNLKFFQKIFSKKIKIIRCMPNILVKENSGIVPYFCSPKVSSIEQDFFEKIFNSFASCLALDDESSFHAYTALFGSGPAYILLIASLLIEIAVELKIEKNIAIKLVKKLLTGSSQLLNNSDDIAQLIAMISSAKGTTACALEILNKNNNLQKILRKAIMSAVKTSKKLA